MFVKDIYHNLQRGKQNRDLIKAFHNQTVDEAEFFQSITAEKNPVLYITNNHSGGTRDYERMFVKDYPGTVVLRREGYSSDKDHLFGIESGGTRILVQRKSTRNIWKLNFNQIVISTFIDFDNIGWWMNRIKKYKALHDVKIIYLIHDFHCISPLCNLFSNGHYCGLDFEKYAQEDFPKFSGTIYDWREIWSSFFESVDEIRCFSESSKELVAGAYPHAAGRITVIPHDTSYINYSPIKSLGELDFHIGVIGTVFGDFKGHDIVQAMIEKYGNSIPITLAGSQWWRFPNFKWKVRCLGPYKRNDLQNIIIKEKISCVLFPSLCPETFSYLVSELIAMDLPVICFNYGAQAEKCGKYEKGVVVRDRDELWSVIDEMQKAGTWDEYVKRHPDFHTVHPIKK